MYIDVYSKDSHVEQVQVQSVHEASWLGNELKHASSITTVQSPTQQPYGLIYHEHISMSRNIPLYVFFHTSLHIEDPLDHLQKVSNILFDCAAIISIKNHEQIHWLCFQHNNFFNTYWKLV